LSELGRLFLNRLWARRGRG